nr:ABC transporter substrate-binding protein [Amphibacillus cookii]
MKVKNYLTKPLLFGLLVTVLLIVAACGSNEDTGNGEDVDQGTSEVEQDEKVLTIANATDIESFDIHNNNNTISEAVLINMFDYLIKNDPDGNKIPGLATDWENIDETSWRLTLRDDVVFHNGDAFTAKDVKFTLERVAQDSALSQYYLYQEIDEVIIEDDYTVTIVTKNPDPIFINRLSRMGSGMLPADYIEENGFDHFLEEPIGTGPYQFSSWTRDDRVELVKNEDYYEGEVEWDAVVFRTIPEASTRVSELLVGGVDIIANVPVADMDRVAGEEGRSIITAPTRRVLQTILRHTDGYVTSDPIVREAIDLAIDKQAIVDSIAGGAGVLTRTSVTPGNFGADPSLYQQSLYDPEEAKRLLEEAGYTSEDLEISFSSAAQYGEYAEVIAAMLTEVGFTVNLDILEATAFYEQFNAKNFDEMFMIGIGNSLNDAANNYGRYLAEQAEDETDYDNPEVEELLQSALVNMDPEDRESQYQQVQQIFAEERPSIYLFQMEGIYGVNDRLDYSPREDEMFIVEEISLD